MPATARPTPNPPDSWPAWFLLRIQTSRANGRKWHPRLLRLHPAATLWLDADRDRARLETGHATRPEAEQARTVALHGDAVVVGSAIVRLISQTGDTPELVPRVEAFAASLVQAVKTARQSLGSGV